MSEETTTEAMLLDLLHEIGQDSTRASPTLIEDACLAAREEVLEAQAQRDRLTRYLNYIYNVEDHGLSFGEKAEFIEHEVRQALGEVGEGDTVERIRRDTLQDVLDRLEAHILENAEHVSPSTAAACWEVVNHMLPGDDRRQKVQPLADDQGRDSS